MSNSPFHDSRALRLLSRVGDDLAHLRHDISNLLSHTTRNTIPKGARGLAENALHQFSAGGDYAASRLRSIRNSPPPKEAVGIAAGIVAVGLLALGAYLITKNNCSHSRHLAEDDDLPI